MNPIKSFLATAIIVLGIAGAYFVIHNSFTDTPQAALTQPQNNNIVSQESFIKPLPQIKLPKSPSHEQSQEKNNPENTEENLTELLTKQIGQTIIDQNPDGPEIIDNQEWLNVTDPAALTQELLAEAAQKFNPDSLKPEIKDSDLKISQDNSKEALTRYLSDFQKIVKNGAEKIPADLFLNELTVGGIALLSNIYSSIIQDFYKLETPSFALLIHKKQIELLTTKKNIFEKIIAFQEDPMTTILVTERLDDIDNQFIELGKDMAEFIKDNINI